MPIIVDCTSMPHYLLAEINGEWHANAVANALIEIKQEAIKHKYRHIFLDCMKLSPPTDELIRYQSGEAIANYLGKPYRIVALYPKAHINKFAENVAVNKGADFFVTDDIHEARKWLMANK